MSVINNSIIAGASGQAGGAAAGYEIERSLRFNSADSAYLSRTPSTAGNRKTWTWAGWVKRGNFSGGTGPGDHLELFGAYGGTYDDSGYLDVIWQTGTDKLSVGFLNFGIPTNAVFRDVSAWYHVVISVDTTQSTLNNRVKAYVNGIDQNLTVHAGVTQNLDTAINSAGIHTIGRNGAASFYYLSGYLADVHFIDGQALDPTSFGEFDDNGVWQPIDASGLTYGTNGFHLKFDNTADLGEDAAGSNDWTVNNISVTAGAGNDSLRDSPTNGDTADDTGAGGEVPGNYATLNPLVTTTNGDVSLSNGNLLMSKTAASGWSTQVATIPFSSGKWYVEVTASDSLFFGIASTDVNFTINALQDSSTECGKGYVAFCDNGQSKIDANARQAYSSAAGGTTLGMAVDFDSYSVTWYKNGTSQGALSFSSSNIVGKQAVVFITAFANSSTFTFNFGQRAFAYSAPSGHKALCTANLDDPTIADGSTAMDVATWDGSASAQDISGLNHSPDFVWIKRRNSAQDHRVFDVIRGAEVGLTPNYTNGDYTATGELTAFNSDGYSLGTQQGVNSSGNTYVGWSWDGGHPDTASTGAVRFDSGDNTTLTLPDSTDFTHTAPFTWEGFFYLKAYDSSGSAFVRHENDGLDWYVNTSGNIIFGQNTTTPIVTTGNGVMVLNKWVHIAVSHTGSVCKMFLDGTEVASANTSAVPDDVSGIMYIGETGDNNNYQWNGFISNLRFVKGTALYTSNFTPPTTALTNVTNTKLLCCQSTTSAGAAAVSPNLGGINNGTVWSDYLSISSGGVVSGEPADAFSGKTWSFSDAANSGYSNDNTGNYIRFDPPAGTLVGQVVKLYQRIRPSTVTINGTSATITTSGDTRICTVDLGSSQNITSVITTATTDGQTNAFGYLEVDGVRVKDPVSPRGNTTATTYNPLDVFSVDGTGYSTTSAAGITEGTISLTGASVNRSAGFSIVSWTGNEVSGSTIGHGLGVAPSLIITKRRTGANVNWGVYHSALGATKYLWLDSTNAASTDSAYWYDTAPTSSVFTVGNSGSTNALSMIAYCFAPVESYSAFGSFTGNGSSDGPFVYTGFRPRWILLKDATNSPINWVIFDTQRDPYNLTKAFIRANEAYEELDNQTANASLDLLSNGFKVKASGSSTINNASANIVWAAFAENPFKYARAR